MPYSFPTRSDGVGNTIGASHMNAVQDAIEEIGLNSESVGSGIYASRPASASVNAGRLYLPTDKPVICRDNGTTWEEWDLASGAKLTLPNSASFSWDNQGAASIATVNGRDVLTSPTGSVFRGRTVPATNPMFVKARLSAATVVGGNSSIGLCISDGTKLVAWEAMTTFGGGGMRSGKWTSSTAGFNATYLNFSTVIFGTTAIWLGLQDDGTNIIFWMSQNGVDWIKMESRARLDWLASLTTIGWYYSNQSGQTGDAVLYSWEKV